MTHTTPLKVKKTFASYFISLVSLVTLVFSFFASFALNNISVQANTYPDIPIYTLVNSPLTIGSTEIKPMTPSNL